MDRTIWDRTIWIDVEDLFDYAIVNRRPSGIQRLAFEICSVLQERHGADGRVRFLRHDPLRASFRIVSWDSITTLFDALTGDAETAPATDRILSRDSLRRRAGVASVDASTARPNMRQVVRAWVPRLPDRMRKPMLRFRILQPQAMRALGDLLRELRPRRAEAPTAPVTIDASTETGATTEAASESFRKLVAPGDVLLALGASWVHPDYGRLLAAVRARHGMFTALLFYDLIPIRRPEWCDSRLVRQFAEWFVGTVPQCDTVFAISHATAADLVSYAHQQGLSWSGSAKPIPLGTGFCSAAPGMEAESTLPLPDRYVLYVSTIEARKNHVLLFRVWRRLLEELPRERVPSLVFAGRIGWLVADLMQEIENSDYLDGKLMIVCDPSDRNLHRLYASCLFTVFPSLFEGWGLPVTESLALGKPCVISNSTSLPEAGGSLARYFDPESVPDAYRVIRATVEDPADLNAWQEQVIREFRPGSWQRTVDAILAGLAKPDIRTMPRTGAELGVHN